jgi:hypothetical protein
LEFVAFIFKLNPAFINATQVDYYFIVGSISKLNVSKFKVLVEALEALPEDIRSNEVDMSSTDEPTCGAVGCFTGILPKRHK